MACVLRGCLQRPPANRPLQCDVDSHGQVDSPADGRGVPWRRSSPWVLVQGSGWNLWRLVSSASPEHGHSGDHHEPEITLAESVCRAGDRLNSKRMPGPHSCVRRESPPAGSQKLRPLLQSVAPPLLAREERPRSPRHRAAGPGSRHRGPPGRRPSSSVQASGLSSYHTIASCRSVGYVCPDPDFTPRSAYATRLPFPRSGTCGTTPHVRASRSCPTNGQTEFLRWTAQEITQEGGMDEMRRPQRDAPPGSSFMTSRA